MLKKLLLFFAFAGLCVSAQASTHYYSNSGLDSNTGTSSAAPRQTITQLNADLLNAQPGDSFLLQRGSVFRDAYIFCGSQYQNSGSQTITNNPPKCSGANGNPIIIGAYGTGANPYIDAADPLPQVWTLVTGQTQVYTQHVAVIPMKLYVDPTPTNLFQQQVLPVFNDTGACVNGTTIHPFDMVEVSGAPYANILPTDITGGSTCYTGGGHTIEPLLATSSGEARQQFSANGNTGLQNVALGAAAFAPAMQGFGYGTYLGVFYVATNSGGGYDVYLNLADGSNPNSHVIEATHRYYGALIEGTNYVTVQDLTIMHTLEGCAMDVPYSDSDPVGGNISFLRVQVGNCSSVAQDRITQQHSGGYTYLDRGGFIFNPSGASSPPLLVNPLVSNSTCGTVDTFFGDPMGDMPCINLDGYTAGVAVCVACNNIVNPTNGAGIVTGAAAGVANIEGEIAFNDVTNAQQCIGFSNVAGGRLLNNKCHEFYGEGVQAGGLSTSVDGGATPVSGSQVIANNVIANGGLGANPSLYNGLDCNTSTTTFSHMYVLNNTIQNVTGSGATFEGSGGCQQAHFHNNVIVGKGYAFGNVSKSTSWTSSTQTATSANALYFAYGMTAGIDFSNNFYVLSAGGTTVTQTKNSSGGFVSINCSTWLATDTSSTCGSTDPLFVAPASDNFSLQAASPLRAAGLAGVDIGALAYVTPSTGNSTWQGFVLFQGYVPR